MFFSEQLLLMKMLVITKGSHPNIIFFVKSLYVEYINNIAYNLFLYASRGKWQMF